ncbi:hypothetical protein ACX0G9_07205 [Flavitalea flava]
MNKRTRIYLLTLGLTALGVQAFAQQFTEAYLDSLIQVKTQALVARNSKFMLTGYMSAGITFVKNGSSYSGVGLSPIFLWKPADRIFFEAEFETGLQGSQTMINLEYADVSFYLNKYMTIRAGKFLSPFGIYEDRLHPGWINKLPSIPLGLDHDNSPVGPTSEIGVDVGGGIPLGTATMNYSVYVTNGPTLNTTAGDPTLMGQLNYANADDNNKSKSTGGRIGLLPFSNSSLEIGASAQFGKVGDKGTQYENVGTHQYALDLSYGKQLEFIKGYIDFKGQWNWVNVDNAVYKDPSDSTGNSTLSFSNKRNAVFGQVAYRPSMSQNKLLKKTELVFRYSGFNPPKAMAGTEKQMQYTYGLTYWYTWRTAFKLAWQSQSNNNAFYMQVAVGF